MSDRKRIEELEKRVKELEARPIVYPAIVVMPASQPATFPWPYAPPAQPWSPWPQLGPTIVYSHDQTVPPFGAPGTFIS